MNLSSGKPPKFLMNLTKIHHKFHFDSTISFVMNTSFSADSFAAAKSERSAPAGEVMAGLEPAPKKRRRSGVSEAPPRLSALMEYIFLFFSIEKFSFKN